MGENQPKGLLIEGFEAKDPSPKLFQSNVRSIAVAYLFPLFRFQIITQKIECIHKQISK